MNHYKIRLSGKPQSTQHLYGVSRIGYRYMKPEARETKEAYAWEARAQWNAPLLRKRLAVRFDLYFPDARIRDIDNYHKIALDALNGVVWEDDKQIQDLRTVIKEASGDPRIEIIISEI